eukprot:9004547-Pyramimonas_sp.AAC.1
MLWEGENGRGRPPELVSLEFGEPVCWRGGETPLGDWRRAAAYPECRARSAMNRYIQGAARVAQ